MTRIEHILQKTIPVLVGLALAFALVALVGSCGEPEPRPGRPPLDSAWADGLGILPPPQDSSVMSDVLAICQLDLGVAQEQLAMMAEVVNSLGAELARSECPVVKELAACPFCTGAALGWMCVLPGGAPYDD